MKDESYEDTLKSVMTFVKYHLDSARNKYPDWPSDPLYGASIAAEEHGEFMKEVVTWQHHGKKDGEYNMIHECAQAAAMHIRWLVEFLR